MFCSKCGRTLTLEDQQCPHCGNPVGESRFEGTPYTSAQAHIQPNAPIKQAMAAYTRTTYTSMTEARQEGGDVDSRTSYRPVYEGNFVPEEIRKDMRAAVNGTEAEAAEAPAAPEVKVENLSEEAKDTLNAVEEELKMEAMDTSQLQPRPIESTGRAGISAGVEDYIQKLEANQTRRASRRRRAAAAEAPEEESYTAPEGQPVYDDMENANPDIDTEQNEVFDDIEDEEFDEMRYGRTLGLMDILKVALIMVLAAALIVGGVLWFRHIRSNASSAKIEGVSSALYRDGIELIKSHAEESYISELTGVFATDGAIGLANRVDADSKSIDALMPANPAENDQLFVSALQTIQNNIGNAVLSDAQAATSGAEGSEEASQQRWSIVNNAITQLENATAAAELTSILNGEQVTIAAEPTATPAPETLYTNLQKGDKNDQVLELQNRLYELGYLQDDRDGAFGINTQTAVKYFQSAVGVEVTGIADVQTQALLFSDDAPATSLAPAKPTGDTSGSTQTATDTASAAGTDAEGDGDYIVDETGLTDDTLAESQQ